MINEADDAKRRQMIATFNRLKPQSLSAVAAHLWVMLEKMTPGDVGSVEPLNRIIEQIQSSSEDAKTQKAKFGRVWHPSSKVLQRTSQLIDKTWGLSNDEEQEMFELIEGMKTTQSASTLLHRKLATRVTGMLSDLLPFDSVREEFRLLQQQVAQLSVSAMVRIFTRLVVNVLTQFKIG